jgi:hypothetical protein
MTQAAATAPHAADTELPRIVQSPARVRPTREQHRAAAWPDAGLTGTAVSDELLQLLAEDRIRQPRRGRRIN